MRKKLSIFLLMGVTCLMAGCTPEDANNVLDSVENLTGVEIEYEVSQEDYDKVTDTIEAAGEKANEIKQKTENVINNEDVRHSFSNLLESIRNASEENEEVEVTATPTPTGPTEEEE